MAFASPPPAPQRGDRTTFSSRVDAFLLWLVALIPQMNTFLSSLTTLAAGGANAFAYTFDTATADADPGTGKVRFGASPQNTANVIRIDNLAGNGGDVTAFLTAMQAGTSNVKASLRLQKLGDVTSYLLFDITAVTAATGYLNLTVTPRTSSAASPFAANDTLILFFDPKGDKGDGGGTPTQQQIRDAVGTLPVNSGGTGATSADVARTNLGLGNVSNTADIDKPVSNAQTTAIAARVAKAGDTMTGNLIFANSKGVWGMDAQNGSHLLLNLSGDNNTALLCGPGGYLNIYNDAGSAVVSRIDRSGNFTANDVRQTSDERKKKNWRALTDDQLDALARMGKVGIFDWIDGGTSVGGGAQTIREIVPEAVHEDEYGRLTVNYGGLCFAMAQGALRRGLV